MYIMSSVNMGSDYQMALLLQKQFEHESLSDSDHQVALLIQEQFHHESNVNDPGHNIVYDSEKKRKNGDSSKSLIDPSWEVIDPTPDIHMLFVAFNQRFFWNKLLAVSVSWSKRMTSCAGICSYRGRGGLCQITLSEPLLKLRPRKDLVETLLHEMIHAYLFVTHNNKDRDGHGPEFHKHMYRINADAGTKITVYHSFHDEVRLYQQHWWRCGGPCQYRKPFFGMVRRAMNRPPGPNDRWWAEHMATCGGKFIKVKEPEPKKSARKDASSKTKQDIRTYVPVNKSGMEVKKPVYNVTVPNKTVVSGILSKNNIVDDIKHLNTATKGVVENKASTSLLQNMIKPPDIVPSKTGSKSFVKEYTTPADARILDKKNINSGKTLPASLSSNESAFAVAKNHWKDKYFVGNQSQNTAGKFGVKRLSDSDSDGELLRVKRNTSAQSNSKMENVDCPICGTKYSFEMLDIHIDTCVPKTSEFKECIICLAKVATNLYEEHVIKCANENFKDDFSEEDAKNMKSKTTRSDIYKEENSSNRQSQKYIESPSKKHVNTIIDLTVSDADSKVCPVCDKSLPALNYDKHLEACLYIMYTNMENNYFDANTDTTTKCLACGKNIVKAHLNSHLEECMIDVFKDDLDSDPDFVKRDEYNCPFCLKIYHEKEMAPHIEQCIKILENIPESETEKNLILNSLFDEDAF